MGGPGGWFFQTGMENFFVSKIGLCFLGKCIITYLFIYLFFWWTGNRLFQTGVKNCFV